MFGKKKLGQKVPVKLKNFIFLTFLYVERIFFKDLYIFIV